MRLPGFAASALLVTALVVGGCSDDTPERHNADLVLINGSIYTMTGEGAWAEALAVRGGEIVAVGDNTTVQAQWGGPVRDLQGAMVLPGFHDAHVHPIAGGIQLARCDLTGMPSPEAIQQAVGACAEKAEPDGWVLGGGWNLGLFPEANPSKRLLDEVSAGRAIYLVGADGHSGWANSEALQRAGIESETPNPPGGIVERDAQGVPSGVLRESAQELMAHVLPAVTDDVRRAGALRGLALASANGITSLIDAAAGPEELSIYQTLETENLLPTRIVASLNSAATPLGEAALDLADTDARASDRLVRPIAAKIFVDGVLEGETAALLAPYTSGALGHLVQEAPALNDLVARLDADGVQVHMHAIGDRAVRAALDAVEEARKRNGSSDNRHHIAHLQLIDSADHARFAELNVTANFQAIWAFPDEYITDVNLPAVGQERVDRMYPIASLARAGARIVGGSDWFVSSINPLLAIETAVTRQDATGRLDGVLNAEERMGLHAMLEAYTTNAAYLMHQESRVGRLAPGYAADLVVLEQNLFAIEASQISEVRVLATYLAGKPVFAAEDF